MDSSNCSICKVYSLPDPLERAHKLLDLYVTSGGYDHWGPLTDAMRQAADRERNYVGRESEPPVRKSR